MAKRKIYRTSHRQNQRATKKTPFPWFSFIAKNRLVLAFILLLLSLGGAVWAKNTANRPAEIYSIEGCPKRCEKEKEQCIKDYPALKKTTCRKNYQSCCNTNGGGGKNCWCVEQKNCPSGYTQ